MNKKKFYAAVGLLGTFAVWTAAVGLVDVREVGPQGANVGFSWLNCLFHEWTGVHLSLYVLTDWLGLVPLVMVVGFGLLGLAQWFGRKSIWKVDRNLFVLGIFYAAVLMAYLLFEKVPVNYRPILIDGRLEVSYPSSTTMLVLCVIPTTVMQLKSRIKNVLGRRCVSVVLTVFALFMVVGRLASGVHWLTDIVGGGLLSAGLVLLYAAFAK